MIEHLLNNAKKFNIDVIDDRKHHERIEFHFQNNISININNDCSFYGEITLIYFTEPNTIDITLEDEFCIGYIDNIESVTKITDLKNFKTIYKR